MKRITIIAAGRAGHGTSTLVQALLYGRAGAPSEATADPARIAFRYGALRLPDGAVAGLVDASDVEDPLGALCTSLAAADVGLVAIATDVGMTPGALGLVEAMGLAGIRHGVVALTKAALVDRTRIAEVEEGARRQLAGTCLDAAAIVRVDATAGRGMNELRRKLMSVVSRVPERSAVAPFRIAAADMRAGERGGTVVTGLVLAGSVRAGDEADALPVGPRVQIGPVRCAGRRVDEANAGMLVSVALPDVAPETLASARLLAAPGALTVSDRLDAEVCTLPTAGARIGDGNRVRVFLGCGEYTGIVRFADGGGLEPGASATARVDCDQPAAWARGDRFLLLAEGETAVVAAGVVVEPGAANPSVSGARRVLADRLAEWLQSAPLGAVASEAADAVGAEEDDAAQALAELVDAGAAFAIPGARFIHAFCLARAEDRIAETVREFHRANPLRPGMPKDDIRRSLGPSAEARVLGSLLRRMRHDGRVETEAGIVWLPDWVVELNPRQQALMDRIVGIYRERGYGGPAIQDVARETGAPPEVAADFVRVAVEQGVLVAVTPTVVFHAETVADARRVAAELCAARGGFTVAEFREAAGCNRRAAIAILEHLDGIEFTVRVGERRSLAAEG